jgi:signal transduction histidine kinase
VRGFYDWLRLHPVLVDGLLALVVAGLGVVVFGNLRTAPRLEVAVFIVALTAYRIVQESLTNARKHGGPAATATVTLRFCEDRLVIKVTDDGRTPSAAGRADGQGHGLVGMHERVEAYGGTVSAGPLSGGGWRVTATLPLTAQAGAA